MNANETTRGLNPTELEQVAGGGAGTFVPNSTFSTSGSTVYYYSWGTLTVSNTPNEAFDTA